MRVLLITGSYPPLRCGVGDYSHNLANALAKLSNVRVGVLTSQGAGRAEVSANDSIEIIPVMAGWRLRELRKAIKLVRGWAPDIVHIQYPTQGYGGGMLQWLLPVVAFMTGKKVVQTWHEAFVLRQAPFFILKAVVPSKIVVVRPEYRKMLIPFYRWLLAKRDLIYIRSASTISKSDMDEKAKSILRTRYLKGQERLVVYFGFVYPSKGAEFLFEMADPATDHLVIAGEIPDGSEYGQRIRVRAAGEPWRGKATITGFLLPQDVAELLSVADAVVLPFRVGGGNWNTSIHAAVLQGSFVLTTSLTRHGYDEAQNIYFAGIDAVEEMKTALGRYAGIRRAYSPDIDRDEWQRIALEHYTLYSDGLTR